MLLNSEVWHSLTKVQINNLEIMDRRLLRKILNAHSKTSIEWLYFDTGQLDLNSLMKIGRLMYYWKVSNCNKSELIHCIYRGSATVWVRLIAADSKCISRTGIGRNKTCPTYTSFSLAYTKNGVGPCTSFGIGYTKTGIR